MLIENQFGKQEKKNRLKSTTTQNLVSETIRIQGCINYLVLFRLYNIK